MRRFMLDANNVLLKKQYENGRNYYICDNGTSGVCYIFCSSNGIYYPNTESEFEKTIMEEDRYEWWGVSHSDEILESAGKMIYVRDVYKQYYVKGINGSVDSIEKLCEFLKEHTKDMRIITCGTSSGGYLATIIGIYLKAVCVFNFGGQWSLYEELRVAKENNELGSSYSFLEQYCNNNIYNQYYDITNLVKNNEVPIMYFYSALEEGDKTQVRILKNSGEERKFMYLQCVLLHMDIRYLTVVIEKY